MVYINYQSYLSWSIIYWFKYCYYRVFIWKYYNLQRRGFYYSIENLTLRHIYQWSLALCAFESMNKNKYVKVKMINLREHMGTPPFFVGSVLLIFLAFCVVSFALFVVVLCDSCVPNAASVSGLQPTRHLKHEEGHNCPLAWWRMWDAQINNLLMVDNGCLERFKDPIPFSRCL